MIFNTRYIRLWALVEFVPHPLLLGRERAKESSLAELVTPRAAADKVFWGIGAFAGTRDHMVGHHTVCSTILTGPPVAVADKEPESTPSPSKIEGWDRVGESSCYTSPHVTVTAFESG
jgi:hypothetical protein